MQRLRSCLKMFFYLIKESAEQKAVYKDRFILKGNIVC